MSQADEYFKSYSEFSKTLRTWFVAYGIGVPALMLTNKDLISVLKESKQLKNIAIFFLVGVFLQVVLAAANKTAMWGIYYGEITPTFKSTKIHRFTWWFGAAFWIEFLVDFATLILFAIATTWVFYAVVK